jgi:tetratricopeptide (TPR) repeat protein
MCGNYDLAISEAQLAVDLEPGSAQANHTLGAVLCFSGQYERSIQTFKKAMRLSPIPIPNTLALLGVAYRLAGKYGESIDVLSEGARREPGALNFRLYLTASLMMAGKESEARAQAAEVRRINPNFSLERYAKASPFKQKNDLMDREIEPLRKAGLN